MKDIVLTKRWDHITPTKTIVYQAGEHHVTDDVAAAAVKAGVIKENKDGNGTAKAGAASPADPAKG